MQQSNKQPNSLEQYVANRYITDLNNAGYQPSCQNSDDMLEDALKIMAALNRATQFIKKRPANEKRRTA